MKKRFAILLLAAVLAVTSSTTALAAPAGQASPFVDLPADHWSFPYVYDLYTQGVVAGDPEGTFRGGDPMSWGESFKLILLAIGVDEPVRDPNQHWAYCYIKPALDNLLVLSFNSANLDKAPTRLEVARMVGRALKFYDVSGDSPYDDCDDGYVVKLYEKGVMEGTVEEDGARYFYPDQSITREEMSTIIWRIMNNDVTKGMFRYSYYWVDVLDGVPPTSFTKGQFAKDESGRLTYSGGYYTRGIDVARYQGDIDWEAVAADGIDFAIIKAGARAYVTGALLEDAKFDENMQGAIDAGLDVGAYYFSSAITVEEAIEEADLLLAKLEPYREHVNYPVVCDWEYLGGSGDRTYGVDSEIITDCIAAFCQRVEEAGYIPMFYFNSFCGYLKMDLRELTQYDFWFAEYTTAPTFRYNFQMWQYSSKGKVAGINAEVDMNLCFVPYPNATRWPAGVSAPTQPEEPEPESTAYVDPVEP